MRSNLALSSVEVERQKRRENYVILNSRDIVCLFVWLHLQEKATFFAFFISQINDAEKKQILVPTPFRLRKMLLKDITPDKGIM